MSFCQVFCVSYLSLGETKYIIRVLYQISNHALNVSFLFHLTTSYIGGNWKYLEYAGLGSVALALPSLIVRAFRTIRRCKFDVNFLVSFSLLTCILELYHELLSFMWTIIYTRSYSQ